MAAYSSKIERWYDRADARWQRRLERRYPIDGDSWRNVGARGRLESLPHTLAFVAVMCACSALVWGVGAIFRPFFQQFENAPVFGFVAGVVLIMIVMTTLIYRGTMRRNGQG